MCPRFRSLFCSDLLGHGLRCALGSLVIAALPAMSAAERLDRGVVAFPTSDGRVYVGWRLLAEDPADIAFDLYRIAPDNSRRIKLNQEPITDSTNFVDAPNQGENGRYVVRPLSPSSARPMAESAPAGLDEGSTIGGLRRIKLDGGHRAQKVGLADFDGDGALDYLVKHPDFNVDPYQMPGYWKKSPEPYKIEAYRSDGTLLWRLDLGWAIETGIWYSPVVAYDLDGDGRAEVYTKGGEGDSRDGRGLVTSGPEYLVKIDGLTGRVLEQREWPSRDGMDGYDGSGVPTYNYYSRNLLGLAYLDGQRPHLVVQRGTYTRIKIDAYSPTLDRVWRWEAAGEYEQYRGQGTHGLQVADIDGDGRDELVIGAAAIDDDGRPLWTTGKGHPDVCYVGDIDPLRPGLEIFYGHEWKKPRHGVALVDAKTGETIWGYDGATTHVHGQGLVADIDPREPGMECYAREKDGSRSWLYSAQGKLLSTEPIDGLSPRAVFWHDGPSKSLIGESSSEGGDRHNRVGGVPGKIVGIADCFGDWREEIIVSVDGEIHIYSTTEPATSRRVCLMQDQQYRVAVALQTMGYFYPPILGGTFLPDLSAGSSTQPAR